MKWVDHAGRSFYVTDSGQIVAEVMTDSFGVATIIAIESNDKEFVERNADKRYISLADAKQCIEFEWESL